MDPADKIPRVREAGPCPCGSGNSYDTCCMPYHHGNLRQTLIDAAVQLVHEHGPDAVSVRKVARVAGVSSGAPCARVRWHVAEREISIRRRKAANG